MRRVIENRSPGAAAFALLCAFVALHAASCTEPNPRPPSLPPVEHGGPELPPERAPRTEPRASGPGPGGAACTLGDVDGDRVPDFALGLERSFDGGALWIVSGRSGKPLFELRGARAGERLGAAVAAAGDVDGDGTPDALAGAPGEPTDGLGRALVVSGRDGRVVLELAPRGRAFGFGATVSGAGDVDGDGRSDLAVGSLGPALATLFSGRDGSVLRAVEGAPEREPACVLGVGDLDGDGRDELALGEPAHVADGRFLGRVRILSGATGASLIEVPGDVDTALFGAALAPAGDADRDGLPDVLIGAPPFGAFVIAGADGSTLRAFADARPGAGLSGIGASVATIGDLDEDGAPDYAIGCESVGASSAANFVAIHSSALGGVLGRLHFGTDRARVAAAGDVDVDGVADLLIAFPALGLARVYSGATMALLVHVDPLASGIDDVGMRVERPAAE